VKPEARWKPPFPVGYAAAIDSVGSVAAPLLASVSAALATLVVPNEEAFRQAAHAADIRERMATSQFGLILGGTGTPTW
jgi:hypothetical protein